MLKIRLQRVGRKHEPSFRLVLTDSKNSTKSGKYLENLGNYDARRGEKSEFKADRITYWVSKGAQLSGTVHNLLVDKKVVTGKKINVLPLKKAIVKEAPAEAPAPAPAETPIAEAPATIEEPAPVDVIVEPAPAPAPAEETPIA
ncbi:MAG: small subunit ribosomal protein S16 [Parcubacteria group bacterium Gr01-1014_46]|nr:MAG: small subunit ribosomal protein S16 [Parcubacteria group bacterium Gr01-1014_46]